MYLSVPGFEPTSSGFLRECVTLKAKLADEPADYCTIIVWACIYKVSYNFS